MRVVALQSAEDNVGDGDVTEEDRRCSSSSRETRPVRRQQPWRAHCRLQLRRLGRLQDHIHHRRIGRLVAYRHQR